MAASLEDIILPKHAVSDPTRGKVPDTNCTDCCSDEVVFGARHIEPLRRFVIVYGCRACGLRWIPPVCVNPDDTARVNFIGSKAWFDVNRVD